MLSKQSSFGSRILGSGIMSAGSPRTFDTFKPPVFLPDTLRFSGFRLGAFRTKILREGWLTRIPVAPARPGLSGISFSSARGGVLGFEYSGIRRPNILEFEWTTRVQGGAREAKITMRRPPRFPIRNFMVVRMYFDDQLVFTGRARAAQGEGTTSERFIMRVTGLYSQLDAVHTDLTVTGIKDLGLVARELFLYVQPQTQIGYEVGEIDTDTGVVTTGDIELGKHSWVNVMNVLARAAGCVWGVNGRGVFYFLRPDLAVQRTLFVGYKVNDFRPERAFEEGLICNSASVHRTTEKSSGAAGWVVAAVGYKAGSVRDNGLYHRIFDMPGFFPDSVANAVRDSLLADSDPRWRAELKGLPLNTREDLFQARGPIRVVSSVGISRTPAQECDDPGDFTLHNLSGFSAISLDANIALAGAGSIKWQTTGDASGDYLTFNLPLLRGFFTRATWNLYSSLDGDIVQFGAGAVDWTENSQITGLPATATWTETDHNLDGVRAVGQMGLMILATAPITIWIDRIDLERHGHQSYTIPVDEVTHTVSSSGGKTDLKLGPQPRGLAEQIAGVSDLADITSASLEIRIP